MNDLELFRKKSNHITAYLNFLSEMKDLTNSFSDTSSINVFDEFDIDRSSFLHDLASFFEDFPYSNEDNDNQIKNSFKYFIKIILPGSRINENKNSLSFRVVNHKIISALKAVELIKDQQHNQNNGELINYLNEHHGDMYSTYNSLKRLLEDAASSQNFSLKVKEDEDSLLFYIHVPFRSHLVHSHGRMFTASIIRDLTLAVSKCLHLSQYEEIYSNLVEQYEDHINKKIEQMNEKAINQNKEIILSSIKRDISNEPTPVIHYIREVHKHQIYKEVDSSHLIVPGLNINVLSKKDEDGSRRFMMVPVGYSDKLPEGFEYEKSDGVPFITSITSVEEFSVENGIEYAKVVIGSLWSIKIQTEPFKSLLPDDYEESLDKFNQVYQEALDSSSEEKEDVSQNQSEHDVVHMSDYEESRQNSLYDLIKKQLDEEKEKEVVEIPDFELVEENQVDQEKYNFFKSRLEYLSELDDTLEFFSKTGLDYTDIEDGIYFVDNNLHLFVKDKLDPKVQFFIKISPECTNPIKYLRVIRGIDSGVDEVPIRIYPVTHFHDRNTIYTII